MQLPDTPAGARKAILAGTGGVLLVLAAVLGVPRMSQEAHRDDSVVVPACVQEEAARAQDSTDDSGSPESPRRSADPARGVPVTLRIPDLGIDASVTPVVADADGVLVPPSDHTTVGWWADGAKSGSPRGTVLITGHAVRAGGGAFDGLASLEPGALVHVTTAKGQIAYRVDAVEDYSKNQLASISGELFSQTAVGQLVLVTCSNYFAGSYRGNTVVVAHPWSGRPEPEPAPAE